MERIKIVLAEPHTLFREGLKGLLAHERDLLVTAEATRADDVETAVGKGTADVLLLNLKMLGNEAVQTLLRLKEDHPETRTMILTAYGDENSVVNTAKAGARGYVLKDVSPETLFRAVRTIHGGGLWIDQTLPGATEFAAIAAHTYAEPLGEDADGLKSLTRREMEVLMLLAEGLSNDEIANKTFISARTVKVHVTNIFAKLKVNNRVKAALAILRRGATAPVPAPSPAPRPRAGSARGR